MDNIGLKVTIDKEKIGVFGFNSRQHVLVGELRQRNALEINTPPQMEFTMAGVEDIKNVSVKTIFHQKLSENSVISIEIVGEENFSSQMEGTTSKNSMIEKEEILEIIKNLHNDNPNQV
ncbi:MAG: hypothetical protein NWR72_00775 [Bacteroidia bacterium]|nr:hypothetical protein [Bacteroidia bacterium]